MTTISRLFQPCGPAAIAWLVVAVIVDAIECITGWTRSDVSNEQRDLVPALANFYSAPAIVGKSHMPRIIATREHAAPNMVERVPFETVNFLSLANSLVSQTAARLRMTALQGLPRNDLLVSATASTSIMMARFAATSASQRDYCPASECLADKINSGKIENRHRDLSSRFRCSAGKWRLKRHFPALQFNTA